MTDVQIVTDITRSGYVGVYETKMGSVNPCCVVVTGRKFNRLNPVFINPIQTFKQALYVVKSEYKLLLAQRVKDVVQIKVKEIVKTHSNKIETITTEIFSIKPYNVDGTIIPETLLGFDKGEDSMLDIVTHIVTKLSGKCSDCIYCKPPQVVEFHPSDGNTIGTRMMNKYKERFGEGIDLPPINPVK